MKFKRNGALGRIGLNARKIYKTGPNLESGPAIPMTAVSDIRKNCGIVPKAANRLADPDTAVDPDPIPVGLVGAIGPVAAAVASIIWDPLGSGVGPANARKEIPNPPNVQETRWNPKVAPGNIRARR